MPSRRVRTKPVIGWREWVALPALGIRAVKVKVDTGALSSAIHAEEIQTIERDGMTLLRFRVHPFQRDSRHFLWVDGVPLVDERRVRSSNGRSELRPVILTDLELLGQRWPIELTLTNRDVMGFRMLLGRRALRGRVIVDPGKSYLGGKSIAGVEDQRWALP